MATQKYKLTATRLDSLKPQAALYTVRDTEQAGLQVRVYTSGRKAVSICKKPKGGNTPVRVKICDYPDLPLEAPRGHASIRLAAQSIISELLAGKNPNEERRKQEQVSKVEQLTLREAFAEYIQIRKLRPSTNAWYRRSLERDLADWLDLPLKSINGDMAVARHAELRNTAGESTAMKALQVLRAVHLYATARYETDDQPLPFGRCPVTTVSRVQKQWSRVKVRTRRLRVEDLPIWWQATERLPDVHRQGGGDGALLRDLFRFYILTGARFREATGLRWEDVDFRTRTFTFRRTKNGSDHTLPMSDYIHRMLSRRRKEAPPSAERVFPIVDPRRGTAKLREQTGLQFSLHDLRRSFAALAEPAGVGAYQLKALLNHKSTGDVTGQHYAIVDVEDMRAPSQRLETYILQKAGALEAEVQPLRVVQ